MGRCVRSVTYFRCACFVCGLFLFAAPASAAWLPDGTPLCDLPGDQSDSRIISDGSNGAIVVWRDNRSGTGADIYAQRVDADGNPLWTPEGIAICAAAGLQTSPRLTTDDAGGAVIAWIDSRNGNDDVYAQRVDADGHVLWTANGVAVCTASNYQYAVSMVPGGGSGVIIAWADYRNGSNYDIYAQRIGGDGAALWAANGRAICTAAGSQYSPQLVSDGSYGAIIAWYDYRAGNSDVYAQRVNLPGTPQWTNDGVVVSAAAYEQTIPMLASDGTGGAVIVWQDSRNGGNWDIYAQRLTGAGTASWTANGVAVCTSTGTQSDPRLISDTASGAIITWTDYRGSDGDIYSQHVNSAGTALWTPNGVLVCGVTDGQSGPVLAPDGGGGAIIAWADYRGGLSTDIYAQKINSTGVVQWSANGIAICSASNNQWVPDIATDEFGGAIITWRDDRSGTSYDVYAGHVDGDGNAGWTGCGVPISTATLQQADVKIISDGGSGAIMAWRDFRNNPVASDIYAQRVFSDGYRLWSKQGFPVSTAANNQINHSLAPDGSGGALVAWEDVRNANYDIYAQHVGSIQNIYWRLNGAVICSTTANTYFPQIVSDGADGAIVVWENSTGGAIDIYAQRLYLTGSQIWPAAGLVICNATGNQSRPQIVSDNAGGAIICWADYRDGDYDIYAQRVDAYGSRLWTANGVVVCAAANVQYSVQMVSDGAGGAIMCWRDDRGADSDIYAQRVNASGAMLWTAGGVAVCSATGNQAAPAIVSDGAGGAIICWEDYRTAGGDVYAQRVNSSGTLLWNAGGVAACTATGGQTFPDAATDGSNGAVISWYDYRSEVTSDVYAQRISAAGTVMWGTDGIVICASDQSDSWPALTHSVAGQAIVAWTHNSATTGEDIYALSTSYVVAVPEEPVPPGVASPAAVIEQNYPNPFNPVTKIAFILREAACVRLCVYDIAGRFVRVLEEGVFNAGRHEVVWDGKDSAGERVVSGVYFYSLETPQTPGRTESKKMVIIR